MRRTVLWPYSLENLDRYNEYLGFYDDRDKGPASFIDRNMSPVNWAMEEMEDINDDNEYDVRMKQVCSGLLVRHPGCTYDNLLMWKGAREKNCYIDWNMEPEYGPFNGSHIFEWFEQYFLKFWPGITLHPMVISALNPSRNSGRSMKSCSDRGRLGFWQDSISLQRRA